MVTVAQLVEPRFVVPVVAGSSPVGHPYDFLDLKILVIRSTLDRANGFYREANRLQFS